MLARNAAGQLWLYPMTGTGVFSAPRLVGTGWQGMTSILGAGDVSGDGFAILARNAAGQLLLYRGNNAGGVSAGTLTISGLQAMTALATPGNWNRPSGNDLITRDAAGLLWLYPGDNASGFGPRRSGRHRVDSDELHRLTASTQHRSTGRPPLPGGRPRTRPLSDGDPPPS